MENHESEFSSIDEGTACLSNNGSDSNHFNSSDMQEDDLDTRSELKFDQESESPEESEKRKRIEKALSDKKSTLKTWQKLALETYGLVGDDLRSKIWPLLLEVDPNPEENTPSLQDLSSHAEYNQVILDVNRSLRRFPPGIPYKQRVALQDQLTVLILRVIMKYPDLRYYQGYHDVAVTFLLVVGEAVAFRIMESLSTNHLRECMEPTMESTEYRLNYIYSILYKADVKLHDFMNSASVGTMFALPWYLTWFGHSLNQYKDVVRLYDYFLASPPLMPLYVAASLVVHRRNEIFMEGCDMASIHVLLSQIPDNLDFEEILQRASKYYQKYPPSQLEKYVKERRQREMDERRKHQEEMRRRMNRNKGLWVKIHRHIPPWIMFYSRGRYGLFFAAATVIIGFYAYYLKVTETKTPFMSLFNT